MMVGNVYTTFYSVDTNGGGVAVATLSVNKLNDGRQRVHQVL